MKTIQSITRALADELEGWEYAEPDRGNFPTLRLQNGAGIWLRTDHFHTTQEVADTDRLEFHVKWPEVTTNHPGTIRTQHFYPYNDSFKITCAASRTIASIAKDIKRRLLPGYLTKYAEMLEVKRKYFVRALRTEANVTRIAEALGKCTIEDGNRMHFSGNIQGMLVVYAANVDINLRDIPIDTAIAIAKLVKEQK